jgi:hypothetical protein
MEPPPGEEEEAGEGPLFTDLDGRGALSSPSPSPSASSRASPADRIWGPQKNDATLLQLRRRSEPSSGMTNRAAPPGGAWPLLRPQLLAANQAARRESKLLGAVARCESNLPAALASPPWRRWSQRRRRGRGRGQAGCERGANVVREGQLECRMPKNAVRPGCLLILQMHPLLELLQYDSFPQNVDATWDRVMGSFYFYSSCKHDVLPLSLCPKKNVVIGILGQIIKNVK